MNYEKIKIIHNGTGGHDANDGICSELYKTR